MTTIDPADTRAPRDSNRTGSGTLTATPSLAVGPENSAAPVAGLEQTILPSPHVHSLRSEPLTQYQTRLADAHGTIAELYHVNSRLRPWELERLPTEKHAAEVRRWFIGSGRDYAADDRSADQAAPVRALQELEPPLAALLKAFGPDGPLGEGLYSTDLMVLRGAELLMMPPKGDALVLERRLSPDTRQTITGAVPREHRPTVEAAPILVAMVSVPWRHMVLYGQRGYRRTLMESGVITSNLCAWAVQIGLRPTPLLDFVDTVVDRVLWNDGVERFCSSLIAISSPPPDGAASAPPDQPSTAEPGSP